jgi:hypothetical protein
LINQGAVVKADTRIPGHPVSKARKLLTNRAVSTNLNSLATPLTVPPLPGHIGHVGTSETNPPSSGAMTVPSAQV